jgi:hypothetical protein
MKKVKFTPKVSVVASMAAGVETEVIIDENGIMYTPFGDVSAFSNAVKAAPSSAPASSGAKAGKDVDDDDAPKASAAKTSASKVYTEEELMDMDAKKDLEPMCHKLGIDIPEEGKNTNAKLRKLILAHQKENGSSAPKEEPKETPKTGRGAAKATSAKSSVDKISEILEQVDDEKMTQEEGEEAVLELTDSKELKKAVRKIYNTFIDDNTLEIADVAKDIAKVIDVTATEETPKSGRGAAKAAPSKKIVTEDFDENLEVGNKVSVFWKEEDEWFEGEVASISKKGIVEIDYEDGTSSELDDNNTKVKILG